MLRDDNPQRNTYSENIVHFWTNCLLFTNNVHKLVKGWNGKASTHIPLPYFWINLRYSISDKMCGREWTLPPLLNARTPKFNHKLVCNLQSKWLGLGSLNWSFVTVRMVTMKMLTVQRGLKSNSFQVGCGLFHLVHLFLPFRELWILWELFKLRIFSRGCSLFVTLVFVGEANQY